MHELSVALSLIQLADDAARQAGASRVLALHVRIGALAGVVPDALRFSFDIAAEGTLVAGARLEIEEVPVRIFCDLCAAEADLPNPQSFVCPICQQPAMRMVQGRELQLISLEVP